MSGQNVMPVHLRIVETFQYGPKLWSNHEKPSHLYGNGKCNISVSQEVNLHRSVLMLETKGQVKTGFTLFKHF